MNDKKEYLDNLKKEYDNYKNEFSKIEKDFKKQSDKNIDKISEALSELIKGAKGSYDKLSSASEDEWEEAKKSAKSAFEKLQPVFSILTSTSSNVIKESAKQLTEYSHTEIKHLENFVQENPLRSICISAGVGFILGKILK